MVLKILKKVFIAIIILIPSCSVVQIEPSDEDWSFVVFGDLRQGFGVYGKLVEYMRTIEPTPKFAICNGDIMKKSGNEVEWADFWHYSKPLTDKMPLYIARGNHEGNDKKSEEIFKEQTGISRDTFYFSFGYSHSYFIILDSYIRNEENSIGLKQFNWLKNQLDSAASKPDIKNVFIFIHHPLYPQGVYKGTNMKNADEVHHLFTLYDKIKAVIVSHEHSYNKFVKDNVTYITTGGAGAPLDYGYGEDFYHFLKVSIYEKTNRINIKTIGIFNEVIEDFDL